VHTDYRQQTVLIKFRTLLQL